VGEEELGYGEYDRDLREKLREVIIRPYMKMNGIVV
jgi:hypothetical protein